MPSITLTVPEQTLEQVRQAAAVLQRPVEEVVGALLGAVLPALHDVPEDVRAELLRMTWLPNQDLWAIAQTSMSPTAQEHLRQLTQLQAQRALTADEQTQLDI